MVTLVGFGGWLPSLSSSFLSLSHHFHHSLVSLFGTNRRKPGECCVWCTIHDNKFSTIFCQIESLEIYNTSVFQFLSLFDWFYCVYTVCFYLRFFFQSAFFFPLFSHSFFSAFLLFASISFSSESQNERFHRLSSSYSISLFRCSLFS